jgi:hypothetical protein
MSEPHVDPSSDEKMRKRVERDPKTICKGVNTPEVLRGVSNPTFGKRPHQRPAWSRGATGVHADRFWRVDDPVPQIPQAPAKINVLAVHEEAFVEAADSLQRISPDKQASSGSPIAVALVFVPIQIANHVIGPIGFWEESVREQCLAEDRPNGREPTQGQSKRAALVNDSRRGCPGGGSLENLGQPVNILGLHLGVRVQEQHVLRATESPANIAASAETQVCPELNNRYGEIRDGGWSPIG